MYTAMTSAPGSTYRYDSSTAAPPAAAAGLPGLTQVDEALMSEVLGETGEGSAPASSWPTAAEPATSVTAGGAVATTGGQPLRTRSRALARTLTALKTVAEMRLDAHEKTTKLEKLFDSYDR